MLLAGALETRSGAFALPTLTSDNRKMRFGHSVANCSPRLLNAALAHKQPSPSSQKKQHFEVVFCLMRDLFRPLVRLVRPIKKPPEGGLLLAGATRLELATSAVTGQRSNQLNYTPAEQLCLIYYVFLNCNTFFDIFLFFLKIV